MDFKKKFSYGVICAALAGLLLPGQALAGRWQQGSGKDSGKWWYNNLDGTFLKNGWFWIESNYDGKAECYYFDENGWLVTSGKVDGSEVNESGAWVEEGSVKVIDAEGNNNVSTNGKNEVSTGTIELGSDMDLGTELDIDAIMSGSVNGGKSGRTTAVKTSGSSGSSGGPSGSVGETAPEGGSVISVDAGPVEAGGSPEGEVGPKDSGGASVQVVNAGGGPGAASAAGVAEGPVLEDVKEAAPAEKEAPAEKKERARVDVDTLLSYAKSFIGVLRYVSGGSSLRSGADCSGFVQQIFAHFGVSVPRDSRSQYAASTKISEAELRPGDLVFYGTSPSTIYHVGIYAGNGRLVHCTHTGDYVREHNMYYAKPYGFGRYIN